MKREGLILIALSGMVPIAALMTASCSPLRKGSATTKEPIARDQKYQEALEYSLLGKRDRGAYVGNLLDKGEIDSSLRLTSGCCSAFGP
ncbi:MAG: hypothetical protein A2Y77_12530 [Planctomycetes bacterium RBG_13_62_9]|nr:MAG: hypothetical protein A2Y77_12530 [Planctomycetes bacterium RBG_13_62_9]